MNERRIVLESLTGREHGWKIFVLHLYQTQRMRGDLLGVGGDRSNFIPGAAYFAALERHVVTSATKSELWYVFTREYGMYSGQ